MNQPVQPKTKYFEIIRALHRGGLSLWLNRRAMLPMSAIPVIATFLTIMVIRGGLPENASPFMLALIQIPADFVIGLFSALIIYIILNAPRKKDKDKPVMFTLNITAQKGLLITAAIAHVIFGYFAAGVFGFMQMLYEPLAAAAENDVPPSIGYFIAIIALMVILVYGMRFLLLPILILAGMDVKSFFVWNKSFGLSVPVLTVKIATTMSVGFCVLLLSSPFMAAGSQEGESLPFAQYAFIDFFTALGTVVASIWCYAALAVGYRQMVEGKE